MAKLRRRSSFGYGGLNSPPIITPISSDYLTLEQASAIVQLSPWTLRVRIKRGQLPAIRIGRRIVLARRDLDAFMQSHKAIVVKA
jgi:excisionase family DNA binding protein